LSAKTRSYRIFESLARLKQPEQVREAVLLVMLSTLISSGIHANWTWNIVWDLFYARITGPIFIGAHATSLLAICFVAVYLVIFRYRSFTIPTIALFGTASIHDLSLLGVGYLANGLMNGIWFAYNNIGLWYAVYLVVFLIIGLRLLPKYELKTWGILTVMMIAWYSAAVFSYVPSTLDPAYFYNLASNVSESVSWFLPASIWLVRREHKVSTR
jgi:hypothetical protein